MTDTIQNAIDAGDDVVSKATDAARAVETSRTADTAALLAQVDMHMQYAANKSKNEMHESLVKIVGDALGDNPTRYIDASRIPLLCKSIFNIETGMKEIKVSAEKNMKEIRDGYVNNDQFKSVKDSVETISGYISWGVKIIVGAVLLAGLSFIIITNK